MRRITILPPILALALAGGLGACTFGAPPPSTAQQADVSACTKQADQMNAAQHYAYLSRTDQYATPFTGSPDPQYLSNRLAQIHERTDRINRCVQDSNPSYDGSGAALPEPVIIGPTS